MRIENRHTELARSLVDSTHVQPRDPSLINLPIPLPAIPILDPLLTILVGGNNQPASTKPAPTPTPPAAPTSAAPPASTPPSGSGGSSGGSGAPSGSSPPTSGSNPPSGGSSPGSSPSGGTPSSPESSPSSGEPTSPVGSSPVSSSGPAPSGSATPSDPDSTNSAPGGTTATGTAGSPGSTINLSSSGSSGGTDGGNGGPDGVANAGGIPTTGSGSGSASSPTRGSSSSSPSIGANGLPVPSDNSGGSSGGGDGSNTGNGSTGSVSKSHNSTGIIVGVIVAVIFIFLAILIMGRRRQRARRDERRQNWWFTRKRTSQTYGDKDADKRASAEVPSSAGVQSVRSSFATTFDHSHTPVTGSFVIPPLPPIAEVGRADGTAPTLLIDVVAAAGASPHEASRFSIGSEGSGHSQYLVVTHRDSMQTGGVGNTPMSVRPFSPSESFAFPKPPDPAGDRNSAYSRPNSITVASTVNTRSPLATPYGSHASIPPIPPAPIYPAPVLVVPNPFGADPVPFPVSVTPTANPFSDPNASTNLNTNENNPFDDPQFAPGRPSTEITPGDFADIEYIKRPFHPNLADEIRVEPDDAVRVLQTFDDGWAVVELIERAEGGVAGEGIGAKGLIPLDCLREPGQPLPAFFAAKRVSSYSAESGSSESPFAYNAF